MSKTARTLHHINVHIFHSGHPLICVVLFVVPRHPKHSLDLFLVETAWTRSPFWSIFALPFTRQIYAVQSFTHKDIINFVPCMKICFWLKTLLGPEASTIAENVCSINLFLELTCAKEIEKATQLGLELKFRTWFSCDVVTVYSCTTSQARMIWNCLTHSRDMIYRSEMWAVKKSLSEHRLRDITGMWCVPPINGQNVYKERPKLYE